MGKPASTLGCYHTCPDKTGKKDHIGGNMVTASSNVFIGGMPAAREGDKLVCRGPADTMVQSSSSVFSTAKAPSASATAPPTVAPSWLATRRWTLAMPVSLSVPLPAALALPGSTLARAPAQRQAVDPPLFTVAARSPTPRWWI